MSDNERAPLPGARTSRTIWPGLVWAIPLSALILVVFLGVHAFLNRGINAVISFDTAAGVKIGDTKVIYQGYEVGRVVKVAVAKDIHRIDLTVRLDRRAEAAMRTGTVFWLVGVKPSLSDAASVKAAFSGPSIGIAPNFTGAPTRHFRGLTDEPAVLPGTPGTAYVLNAERLGSLKRASTINYRGQQIGKVTETSIVRPGLFQVDIFVLKPFDRLVRPGATFWPSSPLRLSLGEAGASAQLGDISTLLSGGLQMETPMDTSGPQSPPGSHFTVYESAAAAQAGAPGPSVPYTIAFPARGGGLAEGAPVTLLGFPVGEVTSRALTVDPQTDRLITRVVVGLEPARLPGVSLSGSEDAATLRVRADAAVRDLLNRGYRAKLAQSPPLIGPEGVAFDEVRGARGTALGPGDPPMIPAVAESGDLSQQASSILGKVDRIPIEQIGQDVAGLTQRMRILLASPKVDESLTHLRNTLAQADQITTEARPQVGPLVAKLRQAADEAAGAAGAARGMLTGESAADPDASLPHAIQELSDAAMSIRALADSLSRRPESIIKGKGNKP